MSRKPSLKRWHQRKQSKQVRQQAMCLCGRKLMQGKELPCTNAGKWECAPWVLGRAGRPAWQMSWSKRKRGPRWGMESKRGQGLMIGSLRREGSGRFLSGGVTWSWVLNGITLLLCLEWEWRVGNECGRRKTFRRLYQYCLYWLHKAPGLYEHLLAVFRSHCCGGMISPIYTEDVVTFSPLVVLCVCFKFSIFLAIEIISLLSIKLEIFWVFVLFCFTKSFQGEGK